MSNFRIEKLMELDAKEMFSTFFVTVAIDDPVERTILSKVLAFNVLMITLGNPLLHRSFCINSSSVGGLKYSFVML